MAKWAKTGAAATAVGILGGGLLALTTAGCPILIPSPGFVGVRGSDFVNDFTGFNGNADVVRNFNGIPDDPPNLNLNGILGGNGNSSGTGNANGGVVNNNLNANVGNANVNSNTGIGGGTEGNFNSGTGIGGGNEGNFNSDDGGNANTGINPFNGNGG